MITMEILKRNALYIAFLQAWVATIGSLYFSEFRHLEPCQLCWYQRIFMYPIAIILIVAILRKDKLAANYVLPLSIFGLVIAIYQYIIQMTTLTNIVPASCSLDKSCEQIQLLFLGFITIPLLSAFAFAIIITLMIIMLKSKPNK